MQIQPIVQAYLTYNKKIWLLRNRIWIPIGGHLVRGGGEPRSTREVRNPIDVLRDKISNKTGKTRYQFLHKDEAYSNRNYTTLSPTGKVHMNIVYFGYFESMPKIDPGHSEIFELSQLEKMAGQLGQGVLENSRLALKLI